MNIIFIFYYYPTGWAMRNSLRARFLFAALVLGILVAFVAHQSETLVRTSNQQNRTTLEGFYGLHAVLEDMKKATEDLTALQRRAGTESPGPAELSEPWIRAKMAASRLAADKRVQEQPHFRGLGDSLTVLVDRLDEEITSRTPPPEEITRHLASLDRLVHLIERRMYDAVIDRTFAALDTSDVLSKLIWGLGGTWMVVTLGGFLVFELVIRRPLLSMARAMEQEGRLGTFDAPLPAPRSQETATLVKAFASMRAQVQSRQVRLQSIIDNASDGIITLDRDGTVKSMNPTAEMLFGCRETEAGTLADLLGKPLTPWPPACDGETITDFQRTDGLSMTLSLKFNEFSLGERTLYTVMVADVTERQALIGKLTVQAERDALTGLYNRRFFTEELSRAWTRSRRVKEPRLALIAIDLDHFKFINDTFGHQAGDQLLIEISQKLKKRGRQGDIIARMGGDEFSILLFDVDDRSIEQVAESYRLQVANHAFHCNGRTVDIGCSLGVSLLGGGAKTLEDWVAQADLACRIAKSSGRNCHHIFRESDHGGYAALNAERDVGSLLRHALAQDHFQVAYQPVFDMTKGTITEYEALARMDDGSGGPLLPASTFIAHAERIGLAAEVDLRVLRQVLADLAAGTLPTSVSVNLSVQSLGLADLAGRIAHALQEFAVAPGKLIFEISETTAVSNLTQTRDVMGALKALGCGTAIDGFGSGYSSCLYLRDLPADMVKLSGETVSQCARDPLSLALVRSMQEVASALGCRAVATWVENAEVEACVRAAGIGLGQGLFFAPPRLTHA